VYLQRGDIFNFKKSVVFLVVVVLMGKVMEVKVRKTGWLTVF
jgi:hypothetical protein